MKYKLTLKYSSFFFTNDVSLVKNVPQEVEVDRLTAKDVSIINAYIKSGAIISDKGELPVKEEVEVAPAVEVVVEPVVEEQPVIAETEVEEVAEEKVEVKKKAPAKKVATKK